MKIFFATDIHGSEICWKKFLNAAAFYKADLVVLGGDVTGKVMVPIVAYPGYWEVSVRGERRRLESREELQETMQQLRDRGSYPAIVTRDELDALSNEHAITQRFNAEMTHSLDRWLDMADGKLRGGSVPCILNGGNDDIFEIDPILESSPAVTFAEGKVIDLGGFTMISMGWTNPTPWDTHREAPEDELAMRIDAIAARVPDMNRTIFNFHAPPYGTGLDEAPELDATMRPTHGGAVMKPVGSTAVREAILRYQPPLSVHGHIHESRGVAKLGRTLTVNPGSSYGDGVLQAALLDINMKNGKVKYVLVNG
ncbi:metallophosphoesterase [Trebonia kvetii]|uniref:Metallophosphoesterase n=1 Tax=Trebonia kvetii TaxID=2480626 RepID=A0A6P2C3Q2_9ACTN|nr:metallophosphoesterase [Trebonia kvetii]TVZ06039.1 metallophosphoesterase [Trebonia kvetii]